MKPRIPLLIAVVVAALLVAAAPALATTETDTSGAVTATLSYTKVSDFQYKDVKVQIVRAGQTAFDGVPAVEGCDEYCGPFAAGSDTKSVRVLDVDADGEPEVLVDLYSGGAHCCTITWLARWSGSGYTTVTQNWLDTGYGLDAPAPAPGRPATFVSADARFAYAFAPYAYSAFPVQFFGLRDGAFADVTAEHPADVRADAAALAKRYRKARKGRLALGVLAAWVADEYRLGKRRTADRFLNAELRAHRLRTEKPWPSGKAFIKELKKDLKRWGYAS